MQKADMNDNFYLSDLLHSLKKETTMERYWPLIPFREELLRYFEEKGLVFRDDVDSDTLDGLSDRFGSDTVRLLSRFLHLYDFNKAKLRDIAPVTDEGRYAALLELLRLPGVRLLRAELYLNSGVSLEALAEKSTEELREQIRSYIEREGRPESVPFPKELNCHKEVAKMIRHLRER